MNSQLLYDPTLQWVNDTRRLQRIGPPLGELPQGVRGQGCECPVANALGTGCFVSRTSVALYWGDPETETHDISLPKFVADFIRAFDLGDFPELEFPGHDEDGEEIAPHTVDA